MRAGFPHPLCGLLPGLLRLSAGPLAGTQRHHPTRYLRVPDADAAKENSSKLGLLPLLNKKLITNSLNILFDLAAKTQNKGLVHEISGYLMFHVYKIFRFLYHVNSKNQSAMFTVHKGMFIPYCDAAAKMCEANIDSIVSGYPAPGFQDIKSRRICTSPPRAWRRNTPFTPRRCSTWCRTVRTACPASPQTKNNPRVLKRPANAGRFFSPCGRGAEKD